MDEKEFNLTLSLRAKEIIWNTEEGSGVKSETSPLLGRYVFDTLAFLSCLLPYASTSFSFYIILINQEVDTI